MTRVNVLFADEIDDVDIILVPKQIAINIESVAQKFFNWIFESENRIQFQKANELGKSSVSIGTNEFIWWLNKYEIDTPPYAALFKEHTVLCSEYPTVLF